MPANTPIYGFTYQCPGDIVDAADFTLLGGQIDTVMTALDTAQNNVINRYNTGPVSGASLPVATGVATTLATPSYTFPVGGIWVVRGFVGNPGFATVAAIRVSLLHNATQFRGQTANTEANSGVDVWAAQAMFVNAGDTTQIRYFYSGTPTPVNVTGLLSARLIAVRN